MADKAKFKKYAAAISAINRYQQISVGSCGIRAKNIEDARELARRENLRVHPVNQGYYDHKESVTEF